MIGHRNLGVAALTASILATAPALASGMESTRGSRNKLLTYNSPLDAVSSASINRWTGKPHEHKREIARRLRQQARRESASA